MVMIPIQAASSPYVTAVTASAPQRATLTADHCTSSAAHSLYLQPSAHAATTTTAARHTHCRSLHLLWQLLHHRKLSCNP